MITRWDPAREQENLPDQPEMLDLMLMKNFGLTKVNIKSDAVFMPVKTNLYIRLAGSLRSLLTSSL